MPLPLDMREPEASREPLACISLVARSCATFASTCFTCTFLTVTVCFRSSAPTLRVEQGTHVARDTAAATAAHGGIARTFAWGLEGSWTERATRWP